MDKAAVIQLVSVIINGVVQLAYVGLTGYGIHQFVGLCKYWIGNSTDLKELFPRRPEPRTDDLLNPTPDEPVALGLRSEEKK